MTWSPAVPGAALRAMRVAAGRRAVQLALLVGAVFVLGVLCGEPAQAADGTPAREHPSAAAPVAAAPLPADANTAVRLVDTLAAPDPNAAESIRPRPDAGDTSRSRSDAGETDRTRPETVDAMGRRPEAAEPIRPRSDAGKAIGSRSGTAGLVRLRLGVADVIGPRPETGDSIRSRAGEAAGPVRALVETVVRIVGASGMPGDVADGGFGDVPGVLPDLPLLPGPGLPGLPGGAPVHILPELVVPGTDQPSAPSAEASDGPAVGAATPSDGPAPAAPHGPALTGIGGVPSGAEGYQGGHGHGTPARDAVTAGRLLAPHAPADHPADGAMGSGSAADAGTQRHGDAGAVPAFHRPVPRLVPGPAVRAEVTGTQDRCRDVPVSPA